MRKSRVKEMSMEVTVGAFMFMVLLALGVFTIVLSSENYFTKSYIMRVTFDDVSGLREGDKVLLHGLEIGKVKSMRLEQDTVHLALSLTTPVRLRKDYRLEIVDSSMLGGKQLLIFPGSENAEPLPPGTKVRGEQPVNLMEETSRMVDSIRSALDEGGILDNLKVTMAQFRSISERIAKGEGTLGRLVTDDELYNELHRVSSNLAVVSSRLEKGEGTIGKLLADDKVYDDLRALVANLRSVSDRLAQGKGTLGKLMVEDNSLFDDLTVAAHNVREITDSINNGEGTLGKLTKDDALYEEIQRLLHEMRATIDDLRETAPITTFTSIFFGAF